MEWRPFQYDDIRHPACTACGFVLFQNPKPTVDALIVRDGDAGSEILLGRRIGASPAVWDTPGGFLNVGDEIEEALKRECRREMGVEVAVRDLIGAYDDVYLDIHIVALFFACELLSGEPRPADYIDAVAWVPLTSLPSIGYPSISRAITALRDRTVGS